MTSVPPPPSDLALGSEWRRVAAIVVLGALLVGQLAFTMIGLLGFGLGGGSGLEIAIFVLVAVGVLSALLWLLIAVIGRRVPPAGGALRARRPTSRRRARRAAPLRLVEAGVFRSGPRDHRGGSHLRGVGDGRSPTHEYSSGACTGSLDVVATGDEVLAHYRGELERDGWTVAIDGQTESPEGEPVDTRKLRANRDGAVFTIALESWSGRTSAAIRVDA